MRSPFRVLVFVLGSALFLRHLSAGTMQSDISAMATERDYSQEPYIILHYLKQVAFAADGTSETTESAVVRVQSAAAVRQFGILAFPFVEGSEDVSIRDVSVQKLSGAVVMTPPSASQIVVPASTVAIADTREEQITVRALERGDVLSYSVRTTKHKADVPGQFWFSENMLAGNVVFDDVLQVSVPSTRAAKVLSPYLTPDIEEGAGVRTYTWRKKLLATSIEQQAAANGSVSPKWICPDVQVSSFGSWEEVGNWYRLLQKDRVQVTPSIRAKALELTHGLNTADEKEHALYNFVSTQCRYLEIDWSAGRFSPHAASQVLQNHNGDCKDKHILYAALCKAVGIEVWPVLIGTGIELQDALPTPAAFDHVMSAVPEADGSLSWVDTTSETAAFGLLAPQFRNEKALVIPSQGAAVIRRVPATPPMAFQQDLVAEATLDASGKLSGHFSLTIRDESEAALRSLFRQMPRSDWPKFVQKFSEGMGFDGSVAHVVVDDPNLLDRPFHFSYEYERSLYSGWQTKEISAPLYPLALPMPGKDLRSKEAFPIGVPETIHFVGRLDLPAGYVPEPPADKHLEMPAVSYESRYSVTGSKLVAERTVVIRQSEVSSDSISAYRDLAVAAVRDAGLTIEVKTVELLPRPTHLAKTDQVLFKAGPVAGAFQSDSLASSSGE